MTSVIRAIYSEGWTLTSLVQALPFTMNDLALQSFLLRYRDEIGIVHPLHSPREES